MTYPSITRAIASVALLFPLLAQATPISLVGTVRDFNSFNTVFMGVAGHPDFENKVGDDRGIVMNTLGADGKPLYNSATTHSTVASATSFNQWYHDDASVNRTGSTTLTLNQISATKYQYASNAYFPIDGMLLGQSTLGHNFGFTTEFHTQFTYMNGNDDTFDFAGDDDVFVFINNRLAIDLGGVHAVEPASVRLNDIATSFGLISGNVYHLDIFQAERHTSESNFTVTTSLTLADSKVPEPTSIALLGLGLLGFAASRRKSAK